MLVVAVIALLLAHSEPASAEGHHCRWWTPDYEYGGYWMYRDCPEVDGDEQWIGWYAEIPWFEYYPQYF